MMMSTSIISQPRWERAKIQWPLPHSPLLCIMYNSDDYLHNQRMLYNTLQRSSYSKEPIYKYSVFPISASNKTSKFYQTPYKTSLTTMNTNNNTLSIYSNKSRNRNRSQPLRDTQINHLSVKQEKKQKTHAKSKNKSKNSVSKKNKKKSVNKCKKQSIIQHQKMVTNKQFVRNLGLNSQHTSALLIKIGKIFDLIALNDQVPYQIQSFLFKPIAVLRQRLKEKGKFQIGRTLTQFKDNCMNVVKQSSPSQIAIFQRMQLPSNSRWSSNHNLSIAKRQYKLENRLSSFSSLKRKDHQMCYPQDDALNRLQSCLDSYLCRSTKYRKVFL